jgi:diguanylate cyclase (GGDEF)-like protein
MQLQLVETQSKLKEQLEFNQSILDSQENILLIHSGDKIISANKSFLKFFETKTIDEFRQKHNNLLSKFLPYDKYFTSDILKEDESWVEYIFKSDDTEEQNVLIMDIKTMEPRSFQINVNAISNSSKYVITLSDVTKLKTKANLFENKATYDALTNVYNRSKFNDVFDLTLQTAVSNDHPLCFAIMDIDFFKKVNDNYGHVTGDETLITFAKAIQEKVRSTDTFARWGGEEFVLSLPGTSVENAFKVVDSLREVIEQTTFKEIGNITCSVGLTQLKEGDTVEDILKRSDEALYDAKESGRNKVCTK